MAGYERGEVRYRAAGGSPSLEHEAHHRGRLYFTLGLLGVTTRSIYGLSEPELLAQSAQLNATFATPTTEIP